MDSGVIAFGYTCVCGERVSVFRVRRGQKDELPQTVTVCCPNGHIATFTAAQIGLLDAVTEEKRAA